LVLDFVWVLVWVLVVVLVWSGFWSSFGFRFGRLGFIIDLDLVWNLVLDLHSDLVLYLFCLTVVSFHLSVPFFSSRPIPDLVRRTKSPYVAEVYGWSSMQNQLTIVMEFMCNGDLFGILHKKQGREWRK
jgi:hypothetical protein